MSTHAVTRRRFLWGLSGAAGILAARTVASGAVTPYKLEVNKIDVYGTRDPQLMAMPSLAEVSGYFRDEGLTVERHFVASAGELPNMLASGNISIGCGGVTTLLILGGQGIPVYGIVQQADISGTQALVLGRKLANVTDPKALNGIKVGQTQGNSPIEVWTGLATELGVPFIGRIPIYQPIREGGDTGVPLTISEPDSAAARAFMAAAERTAAQVSIASFTRPVIQLSVVP